MSTSLERLGEKRTVFFVHARARENAHQYVDQAPDGWVMRIGPPEKSRDQEAKYHCLIGDIAKQVKFFGATFELEDAKRLMIDAFVRVMRADAQATGKPDPFPDAGRVVPSIDGSGGAVQLGVQSRRFTRELASDFIEHLMAFGSENNVQWGEPALNAYYAEMAEQARRRAR